MDRQPNRPAQWFLVLCPAAVGCVLGGLILNRAGGISAFGISITTVALFIAIVAAVLPIASLKKPFRSYRLLQGVGRSPLSRQALLFAVFFILLVVDWALTLAKTPELWLGTLTVVFGVATVPAVAATYMLQSHLSWRHWSTPVSLTAGVLALGVGTALVISLHWTSLLIDGATGALVARVLVLVGVAANAVAAAGRMAYLKTASPDTAEAWAITRVESRANWLLSLILGMGVAVVATAVSFIPGAAWVVGIAWAAVLVSSLMERRLFFVSAVPRTLRSEVRRFPSASVVKE